MTSRRTYYDPTFHGIDIDAKFNQTDEKIKQASSLNEVLGLIAAAVDGLERFRTPISSADARVARRARVADADDWRPGLHSRRATGQRCRAKV